MKAILSEGMCKKANVKCALWDCKQVKYFVDAKKYYGMIRPSEKIIFLI